MALLSAGFSIPTISCRSEPRTPTKAISEDLGVLPCEPEFQNRQAPNEKEMKGNSETDDDLNGPDGSFMYGAPQVIERDVVKDLILYPVSTSIPESGDLD